MESSQLTPLQAELIYKQLRPMFNYLAKLRARMEAQQFPGNDRLYLEVKTARNAVQLLTQDVHAILFRDYGQLDKPCAAESRSERN
jgi:hypothetical protein